MDNPNYRFAGANPAHLVSVGWDHRNATFYVQVLLATEPDEYPLEWFGTNLGEISLARCMELVCEYGDPAAMPGSLEENLQRDKDDNPYDETGPAALLRRG